MTLEEVAELLDVSKPRLYRLIGERDRRKRLPAVKLHGKWFVERERIDEWLLRIWELRSQPKPRRQAKVPID